MSIFSKLLFIQKSKEHVWKYIDNYSSISWSSGFNTKLLVRSTYDPWELEYDLYPNDNVGYGSIKYELFSCITARDATTGPYAYVLVGSYTDKSYPVYFNGQVFNGFILKKSNDKSYRYHVKFSFWSYDDCTLEITGYEGDEIFYSFNETVPLTESARNSVEDSLTVKGGKFTTFYGVAENIVIRYDGIFNNIFSYVTTPDNYNQNFIISSGSTYDEDSGYVIISKLVNGTTPTYELTTDIADGKHWYLTQYTPNLVRIGYRNFQGAYNNANATLKITDTVNDISRAVYFKSGLVQTTGYRVYDVLDYGKNQVYNISSSGGTVNLTLHLDYRDNYAPYSASGKTAYSLLSDGTLHAYSDNLMDTSSWESSEWYVANTFSWDWYYDSSNTKIVHITITATANTSGSTRMFFCKVTDSTTCTVYQTSE